VLDADPCNADDDRRQRSKIDEQLAAACEAHVKYYNL
jgi:hypothetical protein